MSNEQKLREALRELMSIVSIHQKATGNNFAWAEMDFAREALATTEPAVNQQLTTEPVDEREAFEKWCAQYIYTRPALQESLGGYVPPDAVWAAWQARAAMAQGVK